MASKTETVTTGTTYTFTDVDVPEIHFTPKDNPFTEPVKALVADWDDERGRSTKAKQLAVLEADAESVTRLIQNAGRGEGVSVRVVKTPNVKEGHVTLTFFAKTKITRPRDKK